MADVSAAVAKHLTLTPATVDRVTITTAAASILVLNRDAAQTIWVRWDGTDAAAGADDNIVIPPGQIYRIRKPNATAGTVVRVISAGAAVYSVQAE